MADQEKIIPPEAFRRVERGASRRQDYTVGRGRQFMSCYAACAEVDSRTNSRVSNKW